MKLPNADLAIIEEAKVIDYLLNQKHRFGASKARFFAQFGFRPEKWDRISPLHCASTAGGMKSLRYGKLALVRITKSRES